MPGTQNQQQNQQAVKPINYFGLKYDGISDPVIHASQKPNQEITLYSADENWQKFGQQGIAAGKWKNQDEFNKMYSEVSASYTNFKKAQGMYRKAKAASEIPIAKKGERPDYSAQATPYITPMRYAGPGTTITAKGDIVKTGTDQQIAFDKGYAIDNATGKKVPIEDGWTTDTRYITPGEDGSPELHIGSITDRLKSNQAVSWLGPESMHSSWMSQFGNGVLGAVEDIPSYAGGLVRMAGDAATSVMNAYMGKGFKSDSELSDKWNQPGYSKFANILENISTGAKNQSEDYTTSHLYGISNMVTQIGLIAATGGAAGVADGALGLGEESAINLSKAATQTAMAGMVAEPFLKECNDVGIPAGKSAIMAMGVVAATSFVTHKIGADAVFNTFAKMKGDGVLKKSLLDGIEKEMKSAGISDINKVPDSGWKNIVSNIISSIAKAGDKLPVVGNTFNAAIKGGLGMADFTLTQNAAKTAWDEYEKNVNPKAEQGEGLFYKRDSSVIGNLTEGVGSSLAMGMIGSGIFSGVENVLMEQANSGYNSELRNRYMEKEIAQGRYDDLVGLIQKESKKGTWGMTDIGEDGQAIKKGEKKRSMNDVNTKMLLKQASLIKEVYDKNITEKPEFVKEKLGNDKQLQLEMIRNIGASRKNNIELQAAKKELEDKKIENAAYEGKEETARIEKLTKDKERIDKEHEDIVSGKRYSRKYNGFMLTKAGLPDNSDGMEHLIKNKKEAAIQESIDRNKLNIGISDNRVKAKTFISELPKGDFNLYKAPMMQSDLDATMQTIKDNGLKNSQALSEVHNFIKSQLNKLPPIEETQGEYEDLRDKLTNYNSILENKESGIERGAKPDNDKFNENWLLNKNNPSGLETENKINELYDKSKSGDQGDKQNLAHKDVTDLIPKLEHDLNIIKIKNDSFGVYRDIPSRHTDMSDDEKISKQAQDNVSKKVEDLSRKLQDIKEASGKSLLDKEIAQQKLAHENLAFNHVQLELIRNSKIVKFTDTEDKAFASASAALDKIVNKDGTYNDDELNNLERNHVIIDSYLYGKLNKEKALWGKLVNLLLTPKIGFTKENPAAPYTANNGLNKIDFIENLSEYKKDASSKSTFDLDSARKYDEENYKVKTVLNYLQRLRNIDSGDAYNALKNTLKTSWGKEIFPSFEQTNIIQALGFFLNPDNGFINDWNKERGADDDTYLNNGMSLVGAAGVGKNSMVLPLLLKTFKELVKNGDDKDVLKGDILVIGPTSEHCDELEKAKRSAEPEGRIDRLLASDIHGMDKQQLYDRYFHRKYEFIIADEASAFGSDEVNKLISLINGDKDNEFDIKNKQARCLFLLDPYQSGPLEQGNSEPSILKNTQTGEPYRINYRTGSRDIQLQGEAWKQRVSSGSKSKPLPIAHCNEEKTLGVEYVDSRDGLFDNFKNSFLKGEKPWLIVKDHTEAVRARIKLAELPESVSAHILTISMFDDVKGKKYFTAQGKQNPKIYVSMEEGDFSQYNIAGNNIYARFMYTAVTRAGGGSDNTKGYACLYVPKDAVNGERIKPGEGEADNVKVDKDKLFKRLDTITAAFPEKQKSTSSPKPEKDNSTGSTDKFEHVESKPGDSKPEEVVWDTRTDKLFMDKGVLTTTSHEDSSSGNISVANKMLDNNSDKQYAVLKDEGPKDFNGKHYDHVIVAYGNDGENLGNLYETGFGAKGTANSVLRKDVIEKGPQKVAIININPGELRRVSPDGTKSIPLKQFIDHNNHVEKGSAFMRTDPKTEKPYLSLNIRPVGWKGAPVELAIFTPNLSAEDIDNLKKRVDFSDAKSLFDFNKEDPEILGTIDFNQSVIRKIIKQELADKQEGISKYFMPLTEDGRVYLSDSKSGKSEGENAKVTNLKGFYDYLAKNEDVAKQFYLFQGLDPDNRGKPGAYRLDSKHPNFERLITYYSSLGYPEMQFDWKVVSDDNKKPDTDEFSGPVKSVNTNTLPNKENTSEELFLPADIQEEEINDSPNEGITKTETEEEQENLKNDASLINIFGDSNMVDFVRKGIYSGIREVLNPGNIVNEGGIGSPKYKPLEDRINDFKKTLQDRFDKMPASILDKIKEPDFNLQDHLGSDEQSGKIKSAYIHQQLLSDGILNRFIKKLYPGKKESYGGVKQENDTYNINRNLDSELKNIISSIPLLNFDKSNWQQPSDSGFKLNPNTVLSDIKGLIESEGWKGREDIKNNLSAYYMRFNDRTGRLESRESALLSFCKHFFTNPDVEQTGKYSYSFIQDNKSVIEQKYPVLEKDDNFQAHYNSVDNLMNHFYSFFDSNTLNNYYKVEHSKDGFKPISSSASSVDEIKNQFKSASDNALIQSGKDEAGDEVHSLKQPFDEKYVSNVLKETNPLVFEFNKDAKDSDIIQLFSKMGITLDSKVPEHFRNKKGGWERLARIAGILSHAAQGKNEEGLKELLARNHISIENPTGKPLPSDFFDYQRELAEAQHKVTDDAYREGDINVDGKFVQTTVLGSHVTDRLDDGGKHLIAGHQKNMLSVPGYAGKLRNTLNQVLNGRLSFDKIGKVDGISDKFGKPVKFGKNMTDLDVANFQLHSFAAAIRKSNKSQAYPVWGEYGGDGTNMRVYPVKIEGVNKLIEKGEFTKEFHDYIDSSVRDIFAIGRQEFEQSKDKWAKYLKNVSDEEWVAMDHNKLEEHFNILWRKASKAKKIQIATAIDNDPDFINHTDYLIKYDYDKAVQRNPETNQLIPVVSLKLGNATTFNKYIDPIFNGDNYTQQNNPAFIDHFAMKDVAALEGLGLKDIDANTIKAYTLLRTIALKNINPLAYGPESQYKDRENYQKYGAGRESPGMRGSFPVGHTVNSAVIPDIHVDSEEYGIVNRTDGKQIINPLYEEDFNKAFGGDFGPLGKGPAKLRMKGVNPITGIAYDYKCQTMKLNWQLLDKSSNWGIENIVQPSADHFMLEHYMKLMLHPDLYNHFTELRNKAGTKEAVKTMQSELKSHPEWHNQMIHFLSHESVVKTGIRSRNVGVTEYSGLNTDKIYSRDILHQLNMDKDSDSDQTLSRQMLSSLSVMKDAEEYLKNIDEATKNKLDGIWDNINKQIGVPQDSPEFYGKFMDYLRSETANDLTDASYNYLGAKLITNPNISLNLGMLSNMAENKLISNLNKGMLPRIAGMGNVNDDSIYYRMRTGNDGNQYDYEDIRKMGSEAAMKLGLHQAPDEHYEPFRLDENGAKPADIMSTYSNENRKRFGILPGENVNDVFTIHFKDGTFKNTQNIPAKELADVLSFLDPDTIDFDKTPMFRETEGSKEGLTDDEFIKEILKPYNDQIKKIVSYREEFSKSLNGFATRVPFGGLPFGKPTRIRSFIDDYGSTQISNGNWNKMDGQDLDGDVQYTNYFQKENPDKPGISENNKILKSVLDLYNNPANRDLIFHQENIKEYQPEVKELNTRTGLENTLYNYQKNIAGKNCIALEANFSTIYKALYRACMLDPSVLGKLNITPGDMDIYGKHVSALISTELQMALDNAKEDVLGQNNINEESIKLGNAILLYPQKLVEGEYLPGNPIDNKLKETMVFLRQPEIASIYKEFFKGKSVGENTVKLHDIINERISQVSALAGVHEKAIAENTATPEDADNFEILKGSLNRLNQFKELEMLSEGLSQVGAFTSIYSKGIQSDHYKRDNMAKGAHGIEFLLNAPIDKIFDEEEYQKFTNDPANKDWFKNRFTYTKDANNPTEIARQHEIRANINYKKFFDNSPVLKEMWKSYYNSSRYITDNFMKEKPWNDFRESYKKSVGLQGMPSSKMDYKLNKEITKYVTSLFYNMNYGGTDRRMTLGDSTDWYSLGNVSGRERFSNEVIEKFKDIKNNKQYADNQVIRMLGISSERGINRITLNGGNRIPADVMLSLQSAIRELKDDSGFRMGDKKLSIYDMLSGYAGINDNFDSGGHSLVNLFDEKAYKNISNWMENTLMPAIRGDKKFELLDNLGNKVSKTWDELQEDFKHKMLSDPRNKDLLLSSKKSAEAEYYTKGNAVIHNGSTISDPIENSRYGYNPNTEDISGVNNTRTVVNEGESPINTPHDIQSRHYRAPKESDISDIKHFLKKTADPIIENERLRNLAESYLNLPNIMEGMKDVKVHFADLKTPEGRKIAGLKADRDLLGVTKGNDIYLDSNSPDIARVFMHELHHALLYKALRPGNKSGPEKVFRDNIDALYEHARTQLKGEYGIKNIDEFVAEAFSNREFQDKLMKINSPEPWKSVWRKLVEHLSNFVSIILGIDKEKLQGTLLNDVFAVTQYYIGRTERLLDEAHDMERERQYNERNHPDEMYLVDDTPKDNILAIRPAIMPKEVQSREVMTPDTIRDGIARIKPNSNGDVIYNVFGDPEYAVHIGKGAPTESQIREIQDLQREMVGENRDEFVQALNVGGLEHYKVDKEGRPYLNENIIGTVHQLTGYSKDEGDIATTLDKFWQEKGKDKDFIDKNTGSNYVIIKHSPGLNERLKDNPDLKNFIQKDKDGNPIEEVSIFDLTNSSISKHGKEGNNAKPWISKKEKRTELQLRNYQMAITMMRLKEQYPNIKFRRAGVVKVLKSRVDRSFDLDMSEGGFLSDFRKYLTTQSGKNWIETHSEEIQKMLKDPLNNPLLGSVGKESGAVYGQDYMWQLSKQWQYHQPKGFNYKEGLSGIQKFMVDENGGYELRQILKQRQQQLNRAAPEEKLTDAWKKESNLIDHCIIGTESNNWASYGTLSPIKNISKLTSELSLPSNIGNAYLDASNAALNRANRQVVEGTLNYNGTLQSGDSKSELKEVITGYLKRHGDLEGLNQAGKWLGKEQSSKIFERLIQNRDAMDEDGNKISIKSNMLHHDLSDENTKKAIANGEITKEDVQDGKYYADQLWEHYHDLLRHQLLMDDKNIGRYTNNKESLENRVSELMGTKENGKNYKYGRLPYMSKQLGEKMFGVSGSKLWKRIMEDNTYNKDLLGEENGTVNNHFAWQLGSHDELGNVEQVGKVMGINILNNGEWQVNDMKKLNDRSFNIEHILTSFKMNNLRQEKYDNDVIPVFDSVRRLADEAAVFNNNPMDNFISYLEGEKQALIKQETKHMGEEGEAIYYVEKGMLLMRNLSSTGLTAVNLPLMSVLAIANTLIPTAHAIANDMGNTNLYGKKELVKAAPKLITDFNLLRGMGDMYGVMDMSQKDIDNVPRRRILKKTLWSAFSSHFPMYGADYGCRAWVMTAQMIKDGSFDAHSYNKETGKVEYNEKKDRRLWNEDGTQTSSQKALREGIRQGLIDDAWDEEERKRLIKHPDSPLPKGYSQQTGLQVLKDVGDQVIYDMSDNAYMNAQRSFLGKMLTQFKRFGLGQFEQAWSGPYKSIARGHNITVINEYGKEVQKFQPMDYEGGAYTLMHTMKNLTGLIKNPKEFWMNLTPKQKANIMSIVTDGIMFTGLWFFYNQDDIKKKDKSIYNIMKRASLDLVNPYNPQFITESLKEPIPAVTALYNSVQAIWLALNLEGEKALKKEPFFKGDISGLEEYGYLPEPKKTEHKKKVEQN